MMGIVEKENLLPISEILEKTAGMTSGT